MMTDRTFESVQRQVKAMGTPVFEIGLFDPIPDDVTGRAEMLPRTWNVETLFKSIAWLKFQNTNGRNIYIRPKGEHPLTLIDDLTRDALTRMHECGFSPAVIVETSPGNFQAWLNHGKTLPKDVSSAAARALAARFGGDLGSADWRHFGRLAGLTNRKEKHRAESGLFPFVQLVHASGEVYKSAPEFVDIISKEVEVRRADALRMRDRARIYPQNSHRALKTMADFKQNPRYGGDGNRIDLAYAVYALSHGVLENEVRSAIAGRDLRHKGSERRQAEYIERTLRKATEMIRGGDLSR